jgi:PAS domain S-box-containing protein
MIWNSVPLMTAIDLLIIAVAIYGIWRCRLFIPSRRPSASRIGVWLIASGLLVVCLFYAADLLSMHALPAVTSEQEATALMDALHRDLSWLVVLLAMIIISTGFVKLLSELQEREARARRLIDSNIIGVFIWDPDGRIIDANEAFLSIVGYGRDDLVSSRLRWRELTPAEWCDDDDRRAAELKAIGTAQPYEKEFLHKNGNRVPVLVGAANFEGRGDEGVAFVIDLTDRKRAEAAVRESERRYREAQIELAHANRIATMGHLSASIAHEVSQPIGAALGYANAASHWLDAQPPNLEEVRRDLGFIVQSGVRAGEVIDRIRALVKKSPPRKDRLEVNEAVLEVIALTRNEMAKHGISVRTQLGEPLPAILGDRVQLQQVILNLMINAAEAMSGMSEGFRELAISTAKTDSEGVLVAVRDSGPGLAPEDLERLFEAFYTTKPDGLGMGLSICRSIIEAHQGRLWASANVPRGAVFQFTVAASPDTWS